MRIDKVKFVVELTKQDLSLVRLAQLSGVSRVNLSNIKCGKSCSEETANKIANALNVPLSKLV